MTYDPRTIAFSAEILYPPMQLRADAIQGIHNKLFQQPAIAYQSFQVQPDGIHLSNMAQSPGQVSAVTFRPDRMVVREELRSTTVEDFGARVIEIAKVSFAALEIPTSMAQQFIVRTLINPRHSTDSRSFVGERLLSESQNLQAFGRPLHSVGLRLTFPQTPQHNELFHLRIEPWNHDPRSLWVENAGSFTAAVTQEQLPTLGEQLMATYRFVTGPVSKFLSHYDS